MTLSALPNGYRTPRLLVPALAIAVLAVEPNAKDMPTSGTESDVWLGERVT